jgi:hypothetical protein
LDTRPLWGNDRVILATSSRSGQPPEVRQSQQLWGGTLQVIQRPGEIIGYDRRIRCTDCPSEQLEQGDRSLLRVDGRKRQWISVPAACPIVTQRPGIEGNKNRCTVRFASAKASPETDGRYTRMLDLLTVWRGSVGYKRVREAISERGDMSLKMNAGCKCQRPLTLLANEEHEQRALLLAFETLERPSIFSPRSDRSLAFNLAPRE